MKVIVSILLGFSLYAAEWSIDKSHSKVLFHITHLVFNTMTGKFDNFSGSFKYDEEKNLLSDVSVTISVKSINTDHEKRDNHLKSEDFFHVDKFPEIIFKLEKQTVPLAKDTPIEGELTIKGITKKVNLSLALNGPVVDPWNNKSLIFKLSGQIDRRDFGILWNKDLVGQVKGTLIGDIVIIDIQGEANPKRE